MKKIFAVIVLTVVSGCVRTSFAPATSKRYPQTVKTARVIYKGDLREYSSCDIIDLGTIGVSGNSFVNHDFLLEHASEDAAERGGTHLLVIDNTRTDYLVTQTTNCYGNSNNVNCTTTPTSYAKPSGTFEALKITCLAPNPY